MGLFGASDAATAATTASHAKTLSASAEAPAAAPRYVVSDCGHTQVKPGTIYLACADNGLGLKDLHWTSWTPQLASAYGTAWWKDCIPNCADGHILSGPVVVELFGSATVKGHSGERRYTEVTITYLGRRRPVLYVKNCGGKLVATYPVNSTQPVV
ncbi:hypothetical protein [Streptacidiphilus sp. MAP12-33]|uniref:hypothetical protein n=1 Tax=Streptacidiphilus sp. MAP12-33 TaxID=3156266 RepID=UPI00351533FB